MVIILQLINHNNRQFLVQTTFNFQKSKPSSVMNLYRELNCFCVKEITTNDIKWRGICDLLLYMTHGVTEPSQCVGLNVFSSSQSGKINSCVDPPCSLLLSLVTCPENNKPLYIWILPVSWQRRSNMRVDERLNWPHLQERQRILLVWFKYQLCRMPQLGFLFSEIVKCPVPSYQSALSTSIKSQTAFAKSRTEDSETRHS